MQSLRYSPDIVGVIGADASSGGATGAFSLKASGQYSPNVGTLMRNYNYTLKASSANSLYKGSELRVASLRVLAIIKI